MRGSVQLVCGFRSKHAQFVARGRLLRREAAAYHVEIIVSEALQILPDIDRGDAGINADQLQIVCTASPAPLGVKWMQAVQRVCLVGLADRQTPCRP